MQKKLYTKLLSLVILFCFALISYLAKGTPGVSAPPANDSGLSGSPQAVQDNAAAPQYQVLEVIDGDTLRVNIDGKSEKIRLLQVNAPEANDSDIPMGKAATDFTKNFLKNHSVFLEYDKEPRDRYNRLLCYVFISDENGNRHCLNEELIRSGMAKVVRFGDNTLRYEEYKKLEKEAKKQNLGIWQDIEANYPPKK